jgi:hypothetical protein
VLSEESQSVPAGHPEPPSPASAFSSLKASIRIESCGRHCHCQCHIRTQKDSPQWLHQVLGTIFWTYTGTSSLVTRPCDVEECVRRKPTSQHLTYHFPAWLLRRAFMVTTTYGGLSGISGSWSIGFPRAISASHKVWQHIERHECEGLVRMLRTRAVHSNDLADDDGTPLLIVSQSSLCRRFLLMSTI